MCHLMILRLSGRQQRSSPVSPRPQFYSQAQQQRKPKEAKMSQDVFQMRMDAILEQCPGVIGIHDDMVIYGVDQEDHDANLINLLNVCQKEGLVLNSKKLELRRSKDA